MENFKLFRVLIKNRERDIYNVHFCEDDTYSNNEVPFTTVLIGANGTGKSFLLAEVSELFRQIHQKIFNNRILKLKYKFYEVEYSIGKHKVIITISDNKIINIKYNLKDINIKDIDKNELILPISNLAVSYLLNDKFYFANKKDLVDTDENYKYLGIRQASNVAFTSSISNQVQNCLIELMLKANNGDHLKKIFNFLTFDLKFNLQIVAKRKTLFNKNNLEKAIQNEIDKSNNRRSIRKDFRDDAIAKITTDDIKEIKEMIVGAELDNIKYKNIINYYFDLQKKSAYDVLESQYNCIKKMIDLRLININLVFYKKDIKFNFDDASSGEKQILFTFLNMLNNIQHGSLILIDEPEISLHPNWQMTYISCLKSIFQEYNDCHFLIATHSHYIISDLKSESSSVVVLKRELDGNDINSKLLKEDTYAWSAENILYNVFQLRTTRNYYFEVDLRNLVTLVENKSNNLEEIKKLYDKLLKYTCGKEDPLSIILHSVEAYIENIEDIKK
ncbi:AAA family ATPase [Clostridium sp. BSD9I1]|uniref:AAA family ATPase n=1 Tax=Clostridium sp. BSD9I1 TaxID=2003589 RepID=UPI0016450404|nr:AAA family ATPase [Clostridium sp. BSD9I1]